MLAFPWAWNKQSRSIEFFLNEYHWIQWIQGIMTKSKNSIVTISTTYLDIVTFPVIVIESTFSLLHVHVPLGRYLLPLTTLNRYLSRHSSKKFISNFRHGVFLVTIPILCFVTIHWIQWLQQKSFRKNSIDILSFPFWPDGREELCWFLMYKKYYLQKCWAHKGGFRCVTKLNTTNTGAYQTHLKIKIYNIHIYYSNVYKCDILLSVTKQLIALFGKILLRI